jgi:N-acetylglucosaminyldiphosphoundecaprenol N-acetyl-beta-D-mannosaminyltransferase
MNNSLPTVSLIDYSIFSGNLNQIKDSKKTVINTINQYSFCLANENEEFKIALQKSNVLLPDGMAIVSAVNLLTGTRIKKIAGADIHQFLLKDLNKKSGKCFYLGSSESTLSKIKLKVSNEFPNILVKTFSPAFTNNFTEMQNEEMINAINEFKPDVLFVGMTAPKQEVWSYNNSHQLDSKIICSIGAVFDFYAGTILRPHPVWIKLRLEWFIRLVKEPKRMWKRYLYFGPVFIKLILEEKINLYKKKSYFF